MEQGKRFLVKDVGKRHKVIYSLDGNTALANLYRRKGIWEVLNTNEFVITFEDVEEFHKYVEELNTGKLKGERNES